MKCRLMTVLGGRTQALGQATRRLFQQNIEFDGSSSQNGHNTTKDPDLNLASERDDF